MAKQLNADNVAQIVTFLEHNKAEDVSLTDIMSLAEVMADSLDSFFEAMDKSIYGEFSAISREISAMKNELAALCPSEMRNNSIPDAGRELDAVVSATENATNVIMSSAEEIMAADPSDSDGYQALVNDEIIKIFEACSFQDITGQRISKVVRTLKVIDERVSAFTERLKVEDLQPQNREESEDERRARELILHGPQHEGEGVDQNDVDTLLAQASTEAEAEDVANENKASQADIDSLFA